MRRAKYTEPLELDAWDVGLLRHYRAERASEAETGRALIERAKGTGSKFLTVTGDVDRIVPASATATVADLLGAEARTIADTGHLPLDERPQEVADVLLEFINVRKTYYSGLCGSGSCSLAASTADGG